MDRISAAVTAGALAAAGLLAVLAAGCDGTTGMSSMHSGGGGADPPKLSPQASAGKDLVARLGCQGCHKIDGKGGTVGPDLSNEGGKGKSDAWLAKQIRDPRAHDPSTMMPAFSSISGKQVDELVAYLQTLKTGASGSAPAPRGGAGATKVAAAHKGPTVEAGSRLWRMNCGRCHEYRNPNEYNDAQWAVIVHQMRIRVPLTGHEQRAVLAFLTAR